MNRTLNSFWVLLQHQLAPTPQRIRMAVRSGLACMTSTGILVSLQIPSIALGSLFPLLLLAPAIAPTMRILSSRLMILVTMLIIAVPVSGVMVDLPWIWLPLFFLLIALGLYLAPLTKRPVAFQASMTALVSVVLVGYLAPEKIGSTALWTGCSLAVGITSASLFAMLLWPVEPEAQFSAKLAEGLRASHIRLDAALARYAADEDPGPLSDPPPMFALALNLEGLAAVQQASGSKAKECLRLNVMHVAQRLAIIVAQLEGLVNDPIPPETRKRLQPDMSKLREQLNFAVDTYATRVEGGFQHEDRPIEAPNPDWPNVLPILTSLESEISESHPPGSESPSSTAGKTGQVDLDAFVEAMREIANLLHLPPDLLESEADDRTKASPSHPASSKLFDLDPATAATSLKGALATTICLVITLWAGHLYLETSMWTTLLLSQSSYGAVVRKSALRFVGALLGGFLALATILLIMTNTNDIVAYLLAIFVVAALADYGSRSSPHIAYGFLQMGITYLICVAVLGPSSDVLVVLERLLGIMIGIGAIYVCFRYVAPDYAGNQMLRELGALLRPLGQLLRTEEESTPSVGELSTIDRNRLRQVQNLLRLADEAVFEGASAGINQDAALAATGTGTRISLRLTSMAFTHERMPDFSRPDSLEEPRRDLSEALRAWLESIVELIDSTEGQGQPHAARRRHGRAELVDLGQRALPDLQQPLDRLLEAYAKANETPSMVAPEAREILAAETLHFRRLAVLMPRLRDEVSATCVPDPEETPSILFGIRGNHQPT